MHNETFEIAGGHATPDEVTFVGVDGCRAGWFCVGFSVAGAYRFDVWPDFATLVERYPGAQLILVDIPIGLPVANGGRQCDIDARGALGHPRASSVFPAPLGQVVNLVVGGGGYADANQLTHQLVERGLSTQSFSLIPKINEVNMVVANRNQNVNPTIREVHPELSFWALNNGNAMVHSKRELAGILERIQVMANVGFDAIDMFDAACQQIPGGVQCDDFCDALVAAVTAFQGFHNLQSIPNDAQWDPRGIRMEMVYWQP